MSNSYLILLTLAALGIEAAFFCEERTKDTAGMSVKGNIP